MADDFTPHSHVPYGSDGSGYYTDNTIGCFNVVAQTRTMVFKALETISYNQTGTAFTVCDYGTADGGMSMPLLADVIRWLKDHYGKKQEVHVVYEDQPVNDFKSLFLRIHGLLPGPPSYYKEFSNVFVTASGTSFYSQCVPSKSVHLGFSTTAFHWLSKRPGDLSDAIHHVCSNNAEEVQAFSSQSAKDWQTILLHRGQELVPGGQLVIACFCVDSDGNYLGKSPNLKCSMYEVMTDCWREMVTEGKITQDEFKMTHFNNYYRTVGEFKQPFTEGSLVYKAGLRLLNIETKIVRCPYHTKWIQEGHKDDPIAARKHAKWYIPTTRTWSNTTFLSALSESRYAADKASLVDEFYKKYEDRVSAAPQDHGMDYVHAYICIEKVI